MAVVFPRWTNRLVLPLLLVAVTLPAAATLGIWFLLSPRYTDVGYRPLQPVPFSHRLHAGELAIDCRYCHASVELSPVASIPAAATCMNCHALFGREVEALAPVRESAATGFPVAWTRVHRIPDYARFDHRAHLGAGVGCASCHGDVAAMEVLEQAKPLSMGWCLECHAEPAPHLRPAAHLTDAAWRPPEGAASSAAPGLRPPEDCTGCHQ